MIDTPQNDTYQLGRMRATPFPSRLLEVCFGLPETQARIVLFVVRNTLGWYGGSAGLRKASTYATIVQLRHHVGRQSNVPVIEALDVLVERSILELSDRSGVPVLSASLRYRHGALCLRINRSFVEEVVGDNSGETRWRPR